MSKAFLDQMDDNVALFMQCSIMQHSIVCTSIQIYPSAHEEKKYAIHDSTI
jgi:hypothetical protein